ncbi:hypothetical protein [Psychroserpens luteus]|uniref:Uncharacterized protein n=1 Tax=Psychroserpens luteus TaxID=1434066 RepID=A0ABW5ZUS1_9FLAO|nr:hypothetical protein [Psychroserpens luteus]
MFSSYHWGNPWYSSKIEYLESKDVELPNTYFFGSSRVYRQIDPIIFDQLYNNASHDIKKSYNLGAPATFCPETYYLYENFIKSEIANNVDLVFIELMPINLISKDLMLKERTTYWQNLSDLKFVYKSIKNNSTLRLDEKIKGVKDYFICNSYNLFDIKHLKQTLSMDNNINLAYNGPNNVGYYSLDNQLETTKDESVRSDLIHRKQTYSLDNVVLKKRVSDLIEYHNLPNNNYDEVNLQRIIHLIDISEAKGIELVFVLPQIVLDRNLINLSKLIPKKNLIDLSSPKKFPELYKKENIFDLGHLNSNGAEVFTKLLVNQYLENIEGDLK